MCLLETSPRPPACRSMKSWNISRRSGPSELQCPRAGDADFPVLAVVGCSALAVAGVTIWARRPDSYSYPIWPTPPGIGQGPTVTWSSGQSNAGSFVYEASQSGPEMSPAGFTTCVYGRRYACKGDAGAWQATVANYDRVRDRLVQSIEALARATSLKERPNDPSETREMRDFDGDVFLPRPGYLRFTIVGWSGNVAGWLALPLGSKEHERLLAAATEALSRAKQAQDRALDLEADPLEGVVSPPPGYRIEFGCRRMDVQEGPRIAFGPIDPKVVQKRLELAIHNAWVRDGRPPSGPWSGSATDEEKIPAPPVSRVAVDGPGGRFAFDIQTGDHWSDACAAAVRKAAAKLALQIDDVNKKVEATRE